MKAVLGVDLQLLLPVLVLDKLINFGGAEPK